MQAVAVEAVQLVFRRVVVVLVVEALALQALVQEMQGQLTQVAAAAEAEALPVLLAALVVLVLSLFATQTPTLPQQQPQALQQSP
jgi:hypothetical protein